MAETHLLIGTGNRGKIKEITAALRGLPIVIRTLEEFPEVAAAEEDGDTYEANARIKARYYSEQTGLTTLADDSGLEVEALRGGPGVHSARYGGEALNDQDRVKLLLGELENETNRKARFVCAMVLQGHMQTFVQETVAGVLATEPNGTGGFGYDPIFIPNGYEQTFGMLPAELKQRISHRGTALHKTREFIERFLEEHHSYSRRLGRPA